MESNGNTDLRTGVRGLELRTENSRSPALTRSRLDVVNEAGCIIEERATNSKQIERELCFAVCPVPHPSPTIEDKEILEDYFGPKLFSRGPGPHDSPVTSVPIQTVFLLGRHWFTYSRVCPISEWESVAKTPSKGIEVCSSRIRKAEPLLRQNGFSISYCVSHLSVVTTEHN